MWSVGVICYVLLSGLSPFMGDTDAETLTNVTRAEWDFDDESFDEITDDAKNFIEMLLIKEKSERNTVEQCIRHIWLRQDTKTMKANKLSTIKLKKWLARRRWQKTANAVKAIGRMASLTMFGRLNKSGDKSATPFSGLLKAKREEEARKLDSAKQEEEIDIDLKDPEVAKAASKIQGVFRKTRQPKTEDKMDSKNKNTAPKFTQELRDIEVCEGSAARLDCVVVGEPEPDIRWLKEGKEIKESKHHSMDFGDDDSVSLIIAEVNEDDDGEYMCEATNIAGKATSAAEIIVEVMEDESSEEEQSKPGVLLKKQNIASKQDLAPAKPEVKSIRDKAPEFVLRPRNATGSETKSAKFTCTIEGKPTPSVIWKFEDRILKDAGRFEIYDEDGVYYLEIFELQATDSGMYTCILSNAVGKAIAKASLTVIELTDAKKKQIKEPVKKTTSVPVKKEPPKSIPAKPKDKKPEFIARPKSQTVTTPKAAMFTCKITGTPTPTVQWDKDGKILKDEGRFEIYEEGGEQILEIFDTQVSDSGMYTITALNTGGRVTGMAKLTVEGKKEISHAPKFIKRMKDCKILDAEEAVFECHVTGTPKPRVIWQLDGKDIKDGDIYEVSFDGKVAKLVIPEAFLDEDDGEYTCKVINSAGQVSCTAELIIEEEVKKTPVIKGLKSEFIDKISDMTVVDGHEVKLTVRVKGSPAPKIMWLLNNKPIEECEDFQFISKGDIHTLLFPEIFPEDAGKYTCRASNTAGQSECSAILSIKEAGPTKSPPKLLKKPWSVNLDEGNAMKLQCKLEGVPTPTVSWAKDGQTIVNSGRIKISNSDMEYMIHIPAVLSTDAGQYTCTATNPHGEQKCTVTVAVRQIEEEPTDFRSLLKKRPNLQQLNRSSSEDSEEKEKDIEQKDFRHVLTRHIETKCKPEIVKALNDLNVNEGDKAVFECHVQGVPQPTIVWTLDDKEIKESKYFHMTYNGKVAQLTIAEAFPEDEGDYMCKAENEAGKVESRAELSVKDEDDDIKPIKTTIKTTSNEEPPKPISNHLNGTVNNIQTSKKAVAPVIVEELEDEPIIEGSAARLECRITGEPEPTIFWFKNGKELKESRKYQFDFEDDDLVILVITNVTKHDLGKYTCRAKNSVGQVETTASLIVEAPPKVLKGPSNLQVVAGQKAEMKCTYTGTPDPVVTWMKNKKEIKPDSRISIKTTEDVTTLTFKTVEVDDAGRFILKLENEFGCENYTMGLSVEDKPDPPAGKPTASATRTSVTLMWSGPSYDGGCIITNYSVEKCKAKDRIKHWSEVTKTNSTSYIVKNLIPETEYIFRISAQNMHGWSEPSLESDPILTTDKSPEPDKVDGTLGEESDDDELAFKPRIVSVDENRKVRDFYEIKEEIGKGKFGTVYKCIEKDTNKVWAAKFIKTRPTEKEAVRKEIAVMNELQHPKLLQCADAFESPTEMVMILEYVSGGELFDRVIDDDFELTEKEVIIFMRQICEGVRHMHDNGILHLDLKPENILCASKHSNKIKLIDFGLARKYNPSENLKEMVGTPEFVAPEVINFESLNFATDMWSVGVICYVLLSGLSPFMGDNDAETLTNVTIAEWDFDDESFDEITDDAKDFIEKLLIKQKSDRMSVQACQAHKWLQRDTDTMKAAKISTAKLKKWMARRRWQKTANAVRAIGRMASLKMFTSLGKSASKDKPATPFSAMLKAKRDEEAKKQTNTNGEEEVDIDLNDPEVSKAASKIQDVFRRTRVSKAEEQKNIQTNKTIPDQQINEEIDIDLGDPEVAKAASKIQGVFRRTRKDEKKGVAPKLVKKIIDCPVMEGDIGRFDCKISGDPEPDVFWYKEGEEIHDSKKFEMEFDDDGTCSLIIRDVVDDDDGEYTVKAVNSAGEVECSAELMVEGEDDESDMSEDEGE